MSDMGHLVRRLKATRAVCILLRSLGICYVLTTYDHFTIPELGELLGFGVWDKNSVSNFRPVY